MRAATKSMQTAAAVKICLYMEDICLLLLSNSSLVEITDGEQELGVPMIA
jgi:hypothetical protein